MEQLSYPDVAEGPEPGLAEAQSLREEDMPHYYETQEELAIRMEEDRLRAEQQQAKINACIKALAELNAINTGRLWFCPYCGGAYADQEEFKHAPNCPVTIARQLEKEWEENP